MYKPQRFMPVFIIGITLLCIGVGGLKLYYEIIGMQEENERKDIVLTLDNHDQVSNEQIAHILTNQSLQHFLKRKVVSRIDQYTIHNITIVQETSDFFLFDTVYSVRSPDGADSEWANVGQVEGKWIRDISKRYRVSKLPGNAYRLTSEASEPFR